MDFIVFSLEILILFDLSAISYLVALPVSSAINGSTNPFASCATLAKTPGPDLPASRRADLALEIDCLLLSFLQS
ncbi:MAG: hypothetical protein JRI72_08625 [Deltaproteobacteria bacterium]|nr:hypothetical protein [Deltaproteobacteria bacterium]